MKQILIVEDDIALNSGLCRALNGDDRHIVSCNTLRDAREQIMISKPTLVLLDINLPDGIGFDLLKEIKSQDANIAVILLTANDTDMDIVEGLEIGADDYITKPFSNPSKKSSTSFSTISSKPSPLIIDASTRPLFS